MQRLPIIRSFSHEAVISALDPALISEKLELPYELFFSLIPTGHIQFFEELQHYAKVEDVV